MFTLDVIGPDITASDFGILSPSGFPYNTPGRSIPTFNPTVGLGLLSAGDIVRYTLTAQASARGTETGAFALVNDPNDLTNDSILGASLTQTGGGAPAPIPEPGTVVLLGAAGGLFLLLRRRTKTGGSA